MKARRFEEIAEWLRACGLRPSRPRLAVLSFLEKQGQHLTPYQIFEGLRAAGEPVSLPTLYQNLQALSRGGLIKRIVGPDGAVRYDVNLAPHHHLVCEQCGRLVDVALSGPLEARPVLLSAEAGREGADAETAGWRIRGAQVEFRGLCPECAAPRRTGHPTPRAGALASPPGRRARAR